MEFLFCVNEETNDMFWYKKWTCIVNMLEICKWANLHDNMFMTKILMWNGQLDFIPTEQHQ